MSLGQNFPQMFLEVFTFLGFQNSNRRFARTEKVGSIILYKVSLSHKLLVLGLKCYMEARELTSLSLKAYVLVNRAHQCARDPMMRE